MRFSLKHKTVAEWLILIALAGPFFFHILIDIFKLPSALKYGVDVIWILLLIFLLLRGKNMPNRQSQRIAMWYGLFFLSTLIGTIMEYQNILYMLWGLRNYLRFFIVFLACIVYLRQKSAVSFLSFMDKLFYVNFVVTLYQFFFAGLKQDHLGGIFGTEVGCNGYTNNFLLIIVIWHVLHYMNGEESFMVCANKVLISLLIAVLAELKIFFVEFVLVVLLATIISKNSPRKLWFIVVGAIVMLVALEMLYVIFPNFANWFKMENIIEILASEKGYTASGDINRLTFYPIIMNRFLETWVQKLFGLGLGNCDVALGFDFLTTPFYRMHQNLHYNWFSSAFLLLETGIVGLGLYLWVFVQIYLGVRQCQRKGYADATLCQLAMIVAAMCPVLVIYNNSLRTEAGYMVYFVLALPFLKRGGQRNGTEQN